VNLGLIVEGHGDRKAVPLLVRRIVAEICPEFPLNIPEPFRLKRGWMTKETELAKAVELVARKSGAGSPILIVLDADSDLGCRIAPEIQSMALRVRDDRPISVVAAVREYEAWIVAGIGPLAGQHGLEAALPGVEDAEAVSNPKAWLDRHMEHAYAETVDQAILTRHFDLAQARRVYSFDKLERELVRILGLERAAPGSARE